MIGSSYATGIMTRQVEKLCSMPIELWKPVEKRCARNAPSGSCGMEVDLRLFQSNESVWVEASGSWRKMGFERGPSIIGELVGNCSTYFRHRTQRQRTQ